MNVILWAVVLAVAVRTVLAWRASRRRPDQVAYRQQLTADRAVVDQRIDQAGAVLDRQRALHGQVDDLHRRRREAIDAGRPAEAADHARRARRLLAEARELAETCDDRLLGAKGRLAAIEASRIAFRSARR